MNIGTVILLCWLFLVIGYTIGSWKEGKVVSKAIDDLSAMHYKEIRMIIDKILDLKKEKGGKE